MLKFSRKNNIKRPCLRENFFVFIGLFSRREYLEYEILSWRQSRMLHFGVFQAISPSTRACEPKIFLVSLKPPCQSLHRTHKKVDSVLDFFYNHWRYQLHGLMILGVETSDDELDLPYIYLIPKMHNNPYKHRFIAGASKCSTKPLSILLTKLLTHILARSSEVLRNRLRKKRDLSDVDL